MSSGTTEEGAGPGEGSGPLARLQAMFDEWVLGLSARVVFAGTLLVYYINSATTKVGDGVFGVLNPSAGAFAQIVPPIAENYVYDTSAIPIFPWHAVVILGTVSEFVLPALLVLGLFTRVAGFGMLVFVVVQTFVDVAFHGSGLGAWFNTAPGDLVDERALWVFLFLVLSIRGAGRLSVDALLFGRAKAP